METEHTRSFRFYLMISFFFHLQDARGWLAAKSLRDSLPDR
jgi:hypothetical protein